LRKNEKDAMSLIWRGIAHEKAGQADAASADYATARQVADGAMALNNICWALATQSVSLTLALDLCGSAVQQRPDFAPFLDSLAFVLLRLGRYEEAVADYDQALKTRPLSAGSLYGRGIANRRRGEASAGDEDIKKAESVSPRIAVDFREYGVSP
jgi:tetratricopeptide (TPR) repeat protein